MPILRFAVKKKKITVVCDITGRSLDEAANGGELDGEEENMARRRVGNRRKEAKVSKRGNEPCGRGR